MTCRDVENFLSAFLDGELEGAERSELEIHLTECADCARLAAFERAFHGALRAKVHEIQAPPQLRQEIRRRIAQDSSFARRFLLHPVWLSASVAAAGLFIWYLGWNHSRQPLCSPSVLDAVARHSRHPPVEVPGSDPARVQAFMRANLDFNAPLPLFKRASMLGARLSHVRDRSALQVEYGAPPNDRQITVLVYDDPNTPMDGVRRARFNNHDVYFANSRGYNVALWRDREIVYSLVSDLNEHDLVEMLSASETSELR